jgi:TonB-linked SusC/RagA family outer membrane protein
MKKIYRSLTKLASVVFLLLALFTVARAQETTVTGKITDANGLGMPGVNILKKGTTNGTATDSDGLFSISAAPSDVLIASFIGYKVQEIAVGSQTRIDLKMEEDLTTLDEIVVVGYQEMKRADMTSAQASVSAKDISKTVNTTIEQAIQGRAAGVYITQNSGQPGGGISVNIRGINSINGTNEPLYVIDGIQIAGQSVSSGPQSSANPLGGLNPSDIETFEILQGPQATAQYGSRATNGVIVITTKRGKSGQTKITYNFKNSLQTPPKRLEVMNLPQYAQMVKEAYAIVGGTVPQEFLDPSLLGNGTDWQKELFRNAGMNDHQLSMSGGSDKTTYFLSGEYMNQDGIALGSGFKRYSFRLNMDNKPTSWATIGANLSFNQTNNKLTTSQENVIANALQLTPQVPVKNLDGSWGGADIVNGANLFAPVNPVAIANLTTNTAANRQFIAGLNASIKIIDGLFFKTHLNTNLGFGNTTYYIPAYEIGWAKNVNATLTDGQSLNTWWSLDQRLEYYKSYGKHNFSAMLVHEAQSSSWKNTTSSRMGFLTNDILDLAAGDPNTAKNTGGSGDWGMESYLGNFSYNYAERYILNASVRRDGSSNFGANNRWGTFPSISAGWRISQEPFFQVPAINELKLRVETGVTGNQGGGGIYSPLSAGATPTGTGFLPNKYSNPNLKWEETKSINFGTNVAILDNRVQFEFDYFIKNTDNLLMDNPLPWYMGTNGVGSVGSPTVNIGALQNKGFGLTINTVNINNGAFKWESSFNISNFKTTIKKFYSDNAFVDRTSWWMNNWTQRAAVGQSPWMFRGYIQEGVFKTVSEIEQSALPVDNNGTEYSIDQTNNGIWVGDLKFKDINNDGKIDEKDITNIGNPYPKAYAGFTNTFSYKGFDLSVLVTAVYGNDIYNYMAFVNSNPNNINLSRNLLIHATQYARPTTDDQGKGILSNPGTDVPRISYGPNGNWSRLTDKWVQDGSFVRVKNVTLTYHLPASLLGVQKVVKGVRVSLSGQNIATLTHYKGFDPEVGASVGRDVNAANQAIGVDFGRYPLTPVYTFTLGVDF